MEVTEEVLVVIVAGYPVRMRRFLAANPGLASRFHFALTFESYTPEEIVAIARHIADKEKIAIAERACPLLAARPPGCSPCQPIPAPRWMWPATDGMRARWLSPASANGPGDCMW